MHQFGSRGEIRLIGARIGGSLDLTGALIESSDGPAIDLGGAVIEGSVFLIEDPGGRRPVIRGRVGMGSTRILGRLQIRNATIEARPGPPAGSIYGMPTVAGTALSAGRLSVGADMTLAGRCEVTGPARGGRCAPSTPSTPPSATGTGRRACCGCWPRCSSWSPSPWNCPRARPRSGRRTGTELSTRPAAS